MSLAYRGKKRNFDECEMFNTSEATLVKIAFPFPDPECNHLLLQHPM